MSKRSWLALFAASLFTSLLSAGCYTVLKHPRPEELVDEERGTRRECYDCHAGAEAYHIDDPFNVPYYDHYSPLWQPYYARPWWYSDYWYEEGSGGAPQQDVETGGRHAWTRSGGSPRNDAPPGIEPVAPVIPSTGGAKDEPKPAEPVKEKEKDGRHQWTRGSSKGGR